MTDLVARQRVSARPCVPEWCASGQEPHDDVCDNAPMAPMTKREFVEYQRVAAKQAIESFQFMRGDGADSDDATEIAISEVDEAAVCFAGIGSCGRGWCKHG